MKKRIYWLATALLVLAAVGFFLGRHIYLHRELPPTVENISGEWFLRKLHACNVDPTPDTDTTPDADAGPDSEDEWTVDFPTEDHDIYMTAVFDAGGYGCLEIKHEGPRIVHAWYYHWALCGDTLVRSDEQESEEYRIEKLTRSQLVLVIRRENLHGETCESTYYYERPVKNGVLSAMGGRRFSAGQLRYYRHV